MNSLIPQWPQAGSIWMAFLLGLEENELLNSLSYVSSTGQSKCLRSWEIFFLMEKLLWCHLLSSILFQFLSHIFFSFISKFLTYSFYSHCLIPYSLILSWMYPIHRIFAHNTIKSMLLKVTNEFCLAKSGGRFYNPCSTWCIKCTRLFLAIYLFYYFVTSKAH